MSKPSCLITLAHENFKGPNTTTFEQSCPIQGSFLQTKVKKQGYVLSFDS